MVKAAPPREGRATAKTVVRCHFTFVGLGIMGGAKELPPLIVQTDAERERFEKGKERYLANSKKRAKSV